MNHRQKPMKTKIILLMLAAVVCLMGCKTTSQGRKFKMQQSSGRMTRGADLGYYAICNTLVPGSHADAWTGQVWQDKDRAMRDALEHNKQYPGHEATYRK